MAKVNLDFQVLINADPKRLFIADSSEWLHLESKPAIIEIVLPGYDTPVINYFDKRKINIFNSLNLGINCPDCLTDKNLELIDLPDGIYHITLKGSPDSFQNSRYYLRTNLLDLEVDKLYLDNINIDGYINPSISNLFDKIMVLKRGAESHTRLNNIQFASENINVIRNLIKEIKGCKDC